MVKAYAITNVGPIREKNQDGFYLNGIRAYEENFRDAYYESESNRLVAFVCDGVGSTADGEFAVEKTIKYFLNHERTVNSGNLKEFIDSVNEFINFNAERYKKTCATTIAGVCVDTAISAFNVGDSKIFSVNSGYLEEISVDDTVATLIKESDFDSSDLNLDKKLPLIQYLGNPNSAKIETHITKDISLKDVFLCTDGITDMISIDEIEQIFSNEDDIKQRAKLIMEKAVQNGGNDNLTLIYISFS